QADGGLRHVPEGGPPGRDGHRGGRPPPGEGPGPDRARLPGRSGGGEGGPAGGDLGDRAAGGGGEGGAGGGGGARKRNRRAGETVETSQPISAQCRRATEGGTSPCPGRGAGVEPGVSTPGRDASQLHQSPEGAQAVL